MYGATWNNVEVPGTNELFPIKKLLGKVQRRALMMKVKTYKEIQDEYWMTTMVVRSVRDYMIETWKILHVVKYVDEGG